MSEIAAISNVGYAQYAANNSASKRRKIKSEPIFVFDESQRKNNTAKNVGLAALGTAALAFLFRGKIKNTNIWKNTISPALNNAKTWAKGIYADKIKPFGTKIKNWLKNLFKKNPKNTPLADSPAPIIESGGKTLKKTTIEELKQIDTKHLPGNDRKLVQNALDDVPTKAELEAFNKANRYKPPTAEEASIIRKVNAEANKANAIAHQIQNNIDDKSLNALLRARENLS